MAREIDAGHGQVYTVEEVEPGLFQSVFPSWMGDLSALHTTADDAWDHIEECRAAYEKPHRGNPAS